LCSAGHVVLTQPEVPWPEDDPADAFVNASDLAAGDTRVALPACSAGFHPYGVADIELIAAFATERVIAVLDDPRQASAVWSWVRSSAFLDALPVDVDQAEHRARLRFEVRRRETRLESSPSFWVADDGAGYYRLPDANWRPSVQRGRARDSGQASAPRGPRSKESVGQFFSRDLTAECIVVNVATVLKPTLAAWAKVASTPHAPWLNERRCSKQGLHCIGLWHTHPEAVPEPSPEDRALAREHARAARPLLTGVVFAIVGTRSTPAGVRVWVDDGHELREALFCCQIETRQELARPA
jgi:proteasome lid subunit RPN8/RPN11